MGAYYDAIDLSGVFTPIFTPVADYGLPYGELFIGTVLSISMRGSDRVKDRVW